MERKTSVAWLSPPRLSATSQSGWTWFHVSSGWCLWTLTGPTIPVTVHRLAQLLSWFFFPEDAALPYFFPIVHRSSYPPIPDACDPTSSWEVSLTIYSTTVIRGRVCGGPALGFGEAVLGRKPSLSGGHLKGNRRRKKEPSGTENTCTESPGRMRRSQVSDGVEAGEEIILILSGLREPLFVSVFWCLFEILPFAYYPRDAVRGRCPAQHSPCHYLSVLH